MVLGGQPPGRVGRRRFFLRSESQKAALRGGLFCWSLPSPVCLAGLGGSAQTMTASEVPELQRCPNGGRRCFDTVIQTAVCQLSSILGGRRASGRLLGGVVSEVLAAGCDDRVLGADRRDRCFAA
jgi:hypothetical protein